MNTWEKYTIIYDDGSQTVLSGVNPFDILEGLKNREAVVGIVKSDVWDDHYSDGWKAGQESTYDF
jgi:hypothetical protein